MSRFKIPGAPRRWRFAIAAVAVAAFAGGSAALAASSDPATGLLFHPVAATRVLDTRSSGPLGPGATLPVLISGLPDDAAAVMLNVTVDRGTDSSYLTLYPSADARPDTSTINWTSSSPVANGATVNIHSDHSLSVYNARGSVDVIIDLVGYYAPGAAGTQGPAGTVPSIVTGSVGGYSFTCTLEPTNPPSYVCTG